VKVQYQHLAAACIPLFYPKYRGSKFLPMLVIYLITCCHGSEHHNLDVSTFQCAVTINH